MNPEDDAPEGAELTPDVAAEERSDESPATKKSPRAKEFETRMLEHADVGDLLGVAALGGTAAAWLAGPAWRMLLFMPLAMLAVCGLAVSAVGLEKCLRAAQPFDRPLRGAGLCLFALAAMSACGTWTLAQHMGWRRLPAIPMSAESGPLMPLPQAERVPTPSNAGASKAPSKVWTLPSDVAR